MSIGEANHNFNLHIADLAADGTLRASRQFQYYTTTSALSPTPLRNGIAFSYQASTADARNWHIQGINSAGRWYPTLSSSTPARTRTVPGLSRGTAMMPSPGFLSAHDVGFRALESAQLDQAVRRPLLLILRFHRQWRSRGMTRVAAHGRVGSEPMTSGGIDMPLNQFPAARIRFAIRAVVRLATVAAALALAPDHAVAQPGPPELPQPSPQASVSQRVGVTDFSVSYSSPGVKGREIWGGLVPYGELWRSGANAPTKLEASHDFTFGGKPVPAGTYAVLTIPTKSTWTVILNKNVKLQGTRGYEEKDDVARVTVTPAASPPRERLTFLFADTTDDATRLDLEWEKLRVSVPIQVDTKGYARANIDKAVDEAWRPHFVSARYLLDNSGDLAQALGYVDTSIEIKPTWWNNWVRAQILAKQGKPADAVAAAERAQELGKGDPVFEGFFKDTVSTSVADWKKQS
jgi:hypothetical protein